ncbi:hypothetical protein BHE74_00019247 [Ensete ventricosum]|nr:hypothetical protein BHE74_00019247 [Ensete ventricosum]
MFLYISLHFLLSEEEDFEPAAPSLITNKPKSQWDDEDVEDEDVKESWEDEEVPVQVKFSHFSFIIYHLLVIGSINVILLMQAPKAEQTVQATASKTGRKVAGKKEKLPEAKTSEISNEVLADPVAEKLRQQRLKLCSSYIS